MTFKTAQELSGCLLCLEIDEPIGAVFLRLARRQVQEVRRQSGVQYFRKEHVLVVPFRDFANHHRRMNAIVEIVGNVRI